MNRTTAVAEIEKTLHQLERVIGEPVFDEWALVQPRPDGWKLLEYGGNRKASFVAEFSSDMAALRKMLDPALDPIGEFAFSHEGHGSGFDAYICAGKDLFILFNHTAKSTGDITSSPRWTKAQVHFGELVETFISDPIA